MAIQVNEPRSRRATGAAAWLIPAIRLATLIGATAILLAGTPADAPWALGARGLGGEPAEMTHHTGRSRTAPSITVAV
jgi:hypothetical protein